MARPQKIGLDYFPLDVDMDQDDKVYLIKAEHGYEGFGIVVKLFMEIYKRGYFIEWNDKKAKIFAHKHAIELETLRNVIDLCVDEKLFDKSIYATHSVLTSKGIQERYLEATSRRGKVTVHKQYMLVDVNVYNNDSLVVVNVNKNPNSGGLNDAESAQRKGKEIKEEEIKEEKKEKEPLPDKSDAIPYEEIRDHWNSQPNLQPIKQLTKKRKDKIKTRLNDPQIDKEQYSSRLEEIKAAITKSNSSDFLTGKSTDWAMDFSWFIAKEDNILSILEGKYHNGKKSSTDSQEERETKEALDKAFEQFEV